MFALARSIGTFQRHVVFVVLCGGKGGVASADPLIALTTTTPSLRAVSAVSHVTYTLLSQFSMRCIVIPVSCISLQSFLSLVPIVSLYFSFSSKLLVGRVCLASDSAALTCDCQISLVGRA